MKPVEASDIGSYSEHWVLLACVVLPQEPTILTSVFGSSLGFLVRSLVMVQEENIVSTPFIHFSLDRKFPSPGPPSGHLGTHEVGNCRE